MPRWLIYIIFFVSLVYIVSLKEAERYHIYVISIFMLGAGIVWLFSGRAQLPKNFVRYLVYIVFIPLAMLSVLNMVGTYVRQDNGIANLLLLGLLVLGVFLGQQFFKRKR